MRRFMAIAALSVVLASVAEAHFVFVVPEASGKVSVVFSDSLAPDEDVPVTKIAGLKLFGRDAAGKEGPVTLVAGKAALTGQATRGTATLYGSVKYGVMKKGEGKPYLLAYHPKAVVATGGPETVGEKLPVELVAAAEGKGLRFRFLAAGKPVAEAEVNIHKPDGGKEKVTTGKDGWTPAVEGQGRFGAWAKNIEAATGEHEGQKYEEVRNYATLVVESSKR